jgi:hypothetical protein
LARRKHRNQDLHKLGRMAAEILQVAQSRLGQTAPESLVLTQFSRAADGVHVIDTDVTVIDRPPMRSR